MPPGLKGQALQNMRLLAGDLNGFTDSLHEEYGDSAYGRLSNEDARAVCEAAPSFARRRWRTPSG
jgi:hypothetical protein